MIQRKRVKRKTRLEALASESGNGMDRKQTTGRALILHPVLKSKITGLPTPVCLSPRARLNEARGLALAIDLDVICAEVVPVARPRPANLLGGGVMDRMAVCVAKEKIDIAIVDMALSPSQQRNLERAWSCKVIDRTGLILEIFGERARTREGVLQVELAALSYQRGRLLRSWTHLERQLGRVCVARIMHPSC